MKSREKRQSDPVNGGCPLQRICEELAINIETDSKFIDGRKDAEHRINLLLKRKKRFTADTSQWHHWMKKSSSRIKDLQPQYPDHRIIADSAYIRLRKGFAYLSIVTDVYSQKIAGFDLSLRFGSDGCIRALKMALAGIPKDEAIIHHSDRGIQYRCHEYVQMIEEERNGKTSLITSGNAYEKTLAEHVKSVLKRGYSLNREFESFNQAKNAVTEAIRIYNEYRPHNSEGKELESEKYSESEQAA